MQLNNDPKYIFKLQKKYLKKRKERILQDMNWLPKSLNLNPI